jgi:hypothetical protein
MTMLGVSHFEKGVNTHPVAVACGYRVAASPSVALHAIPLADDIAAVGFGPGIVDQADLRRDSSNHSTFALASSNKSSGVPVHAVRRARQEGSPEERRQLVSLPRRADKVARTDGRRKATSVSRCCYGPRCADFG